ncbi:MAG: type II toxin-antitoxin system RelE/ParE family toxin [Acidobacteria bacterium]|nr:type II toxin-antitoxin system RelE/ParE family toxin [Acidobacteriota bacterium]
MTIVVSPRAREDLAQAYRRIAEDNPEAADRVLARLVEVIGMLASGAVEGREVQLTDGRRVRTWPVQAIDFLRALRAYQQRQRRFGR